MKDDTNILEIEVDAGRNRMLKFFPVDKPVRGRIDWNADPEPNARKMSIDFPTGIPGQHIAFDLSTNEGSIIEPLHEPQHTNTRKAIQRRGMQLPDERQTFANADKPTWLFWMVHLVTRGLAKVVRGELPKDIGGTPTICSIKQPQSEQARLADQLTLQNAIALVGLDAKQRAEVEKLIGKKL